jgi:hypothetical protein
MGSITSATRILRGESLSQKRRTPKSPSMPAHMTYCSSLKPYMASAVKLHPDARFLVISEEGRQRPFGWATFTSELFKPDRLRRKVAKLLEGSDHAAKYS